MDIQNWVFILFLIRMFPLGLAGFVASRSKDWVGFIMCLLYVCVTTVNYIYRNPTLNAVFSTPLVFVVAWYVIKRNRDKI